jgi:glycosyltransferase involved in cell wall biosynthesis
MISVVIPTYKRPDLLARLLESICKQTLLPSEVIVVDDASGMDKAYQSCVDRFRPRLPRLHCHYLAENSGAPYARNAGIRLAKYEWVALVDDDDEWLPKKLASQWSIACNADPNLGLIYTWTEAQGSEEQSSYLSKHTVRGDARRAVFLTNFIMSASVMVRKCAIVKAGMFDETLPSCQDWDMWARIFLNGYTCDVVPEILTIYHRHDGDSIGISKKARHGYRKFFKKHYTSIIKHGGLNGVVSCGTFFIKNELLMLKKNILG